MKSDKWSIKDRTELLEKRSDSVHVPKPPFPINLMIDPTNICNHACVFCPYQKTDTPRRLIEEDLVISILNQASALGVKEVGFYLCGEPLIHPGLESFIREAKRLGIDYTYLTTNGALADPKRSQALISAGLDSIKFSINAGTRRTYQMIHGRDDYDTVIKHLRFISEYRKTLGRSLKLGISYVVTVENQHECEAFYQRYISVADDIAFYRVSRQKELIPHRRSLSVPLIEPTPAKVPCYQLFSRAHVTSDGHLAMCCNDCEGALTVVDLRKTTLLDAWHGPAIVELRKRHLENRLAGTFCFECIYGEAG